MFFQLGRGWGKSQRTAMPCVFYCGALMRRQQSTSVSSLIKIDVLYGPLEMFSFRKQDGGFRFGIYLMNYRWNISTGGKKQTKQQQYSPSAGLSRLAESRQFDLIIIEKPNVQYSH